MRTEIPVTHLLQMLGLCHLYGLPFAHYICVSQGQGILLAQVDFVPGFWELEIYPRLKQFAEWWALRILPPVMTSIEKQQLIKLIRENCIVREISAVHKKRLQAQQQK